jgi:hemerythrin
MEEDRLTGVKLIDEEHRELAESINSVYEAVLLVNKNLILLRLKGLLELLKTHFADEERLMKETRYPGYISHKLEHDRFFAQIEGLYAGYGKGTENFGTEYLRRIRHWFYNHLEINDIDCGKHIMKSEQH